VCWLHFRIASLHVSKERPGDHFSFGCERDSALGAPQGGRLACAIGAGGQLLHASWGNASCCMPRGAMPRAACLVGLYRGAMACLVGLHASWGNAGASRSECGPSEGKKKGVQAGG